MFIKNNDLIRLGYIILINILKVESYIVKQDYTYKCFENKILYNWAKLYLLKIRVL